MQNEKTRFPTWMFWAGIIALWAIVVIHDHFTHVEVVGTIQFNQIETPVLKEKLVTEMATMYVHHVLTDTDGKKAAYLSADRPDTEAKGNSFYGMFIIDSVSVPKGMAIKAGNWVTVEYIYAVGDTHSPEYFQNPGWYKSERVKDAKIVSLVPEQ